jgi:hypothetical protein
MMLTIKALWSLQKIWLIGANRPQT